MAKWEQLIVARKQKQWSQLEAAEQVNVGAVTYQRWEAGSASPQPHHLRQLCRVFGLLRLPNQDELTADSAGTEASSWLARSGHGPEQAPNEVEAFITGHLTTLLLSLTFQPHATGREKGNAIREAIKEWDDMDTRHDHLTRRDALRSLATLPVITLGLTAPGKMVPTTQYGTTIAQCAASLEACWELRKGGDASDRALAYQCATRYVPTLKTIAQHSTNYRESALELATRYMGLKAFVARHYTTLSEAIQDGISAVAFSQGTGNIPLQLYAYDSLAWSYLFARKYAQALTTIQEAEALVQQTTRLPHTEPLHPQIQGGVYSTLAVMLARNGQSPDNASGKATEIDPGEESVSFYDFKRSTLFLEAGWAYYYQGDQAKAMAWFEKRVNAETLAPNIAQSELGRVETLNAMTLSCLKTADRDLDKTLHLWVASVEGAKALKSEQRFTEAMTTYELMEVVWPNEHRVADLRDHLVHWEE